jgi:hypothetical protein
MRKKQVNRCGKERVLEDVRKSSKAGSNLAFFKRPTKKFTIKTSRIRETIHSIRRISSGRKADKK